MTTMLLLLPLLACGDKDGDTGDTGHGHNMDSGSMTDTGMLDFGTSQTTDGGTYTVSYTPSSDPIPFNSEFSVTFSATADVMPEGGFTIDAANATMPNHGHGMNVAPVVTDNGDGTWTASPFLFHMEGWWELTADVTSTDGTETATFNIWCCD